MSDTSRGLKHQGRSTAVLSHFIPVVLGLVLISPAIAAATMASQQDVPVANQPVQTGHDEAIDFPPQFDEGERDDRDAVEQPLHIAPQESAALGSPREGFDPRSGENADDDSRDSSAASFDPRKSDVIQVIGALAIVLSLLFVTRFLLTRASKGMGGGGRPSGVVEILARYPVARGQQLLLIKLARRVLLVHQNGTAMTTLSEITEANEVAVLLGRVEAGSAKKDAPRFKAIFNKFANEHEHAAADTDAIRQPRQSGEQGEIIDLTRRPGTLRNLFSARGTVR